MSETETPEASASENPVEAVPPATLRDRWGKLGATVRVLASIGAAVVGAIACLWLFNEVLVYWIAKSYVQEVVEVFDLSPYLARALVLLSFVAGAYLVGLSFSLTRSRRLIGVYGVIGLIVAHSVVLWVGSRNTIVGRCYVVTKDGVRYGERPGIDAATGRACRLVTADLAERLRAYETGARPKRVESTDPVFFDLRTGEPVVWFTHGKTTGVELFDLMGFHPATGEELAPVTREVVEEWRAQVSRRAPRRVDPEGVTPFDPLTGEARLWFKRGPDGAHVFYDRAGFDPETGEKLQVADRAVIDAHRRQVAEESATKCFVITKDAKAPVKYGTRTGIDPATGRACRPLTAELIERLREYEKGNRPKRIAVDDPVFFDPRTGEPIVWYWKGDGGRIEIFDLMGFHPESGEELLPVTKEIVTAWKEAVANRKMRPAKAPQRIEPNGYAFFDPTNGQPRAWFSRSGDGPFEFFDAPGFHPQTGEALSVVTREVLEQWRRDQEARARKRVEDDARQSEERRLAAEKAERETRERAVREAAERSAADEQRERERRAGMLCDDKAGNPTDPRKASAGAPYDVLKLNAREAADVCASAVAQFPGELRYQYQYARAVQFIDKQKSYNLQKALAARQYPAAFDNLGWLHIALYRDYVEGVRYFRTGAQLGDPDSMVSLAEMIDRGQYLDRSAVDEKIALYRRAADLGHPGAQTAYANTVAETQRQREQVQQQQEVQRQVIGIFGNVLGTMARGR